MNCNKCTVHVLSIEELAAMKTEVDATEGLVCTTLLVHVQTTQEASASLFVFIVM